MIPNSTEEKKKIRIEALETLELANSQEKQKIKKGYTYKKTGIRSYILCK